MRDMEMEEEAEAGKGKRDRERKKRGVCTEKAHDKGRKSDARGEGGTKEEKGVPPAAVQLQNLELSPLPRPCCFVLFLFGALSSYHSIQRLPNPTVNNSLLTTTPSLPSSSLIYPKRHPQPHPPIRLFSFPSIFSLNIIASPP